jgi:hypothetical protein
VSCASKAPLIALAFKLEQGPFGQLTCAQRLAPQLNCFLPTVCQIHARLPRNAQTRRFCDIWRAAHEAEGSTRLSRDSLVT